MNISNKDIAIIGLVLAIIISSILYSYLSGFIPPSFGKNEKNRIITLHIYASKGGKILLNNTYVTSIYLTYSTKTRVKVYLKAMPLEKYKFDYWILNGTMKITSDTLLIQINGNTTLSASFSLERKIIYIIDTETNIMSAKILVNGSEISLPYRINYTGRIRLEYKAFDIKTSSFKYKFLYWIYNGSKIFNKTLYLEAYRCNVSIQVVYKTIKLGKYILNIVSPFNNTIWLNNTLYKQKNLTHIYEEPYLMNININNSLKINKDTTLYFKNIKVYSKDKLLYIVENVPFPINVDRNYTLRVEFVANKPVIDTYRVPIIVNGETIITYMKIYPKQKNFNASVSVVGNTIRIKGNGIYHLKLVQGWKEIKIYVKRKSSTTLKIEMVMENGPKYYTKGRVFSPSLGSSQSFTMIFHSVPFIIEVKGTIYEYSGRGLYNTSFPGVTPFSTLLIDVYNGEVELKVEITKD